ncbi:M48 family metallopeptidase [Flavobacterium taihuense]|uniref:M48 family metallopeptidase n=1 Tax=Flavobacterium taihuense TaxID=2857508 RepID=A0ABS6XQL5_9FLAO|nr:M48 family metallopeptidase [Flavobacterium taihuense]MBW4358978.1 M48 family metallopeptidase [Flavobacterium taihuense]
MSEKTKGIFFDGESAIPKAIDIVFDNEKDVLVFETENNQQHFWDLDEVSFRIKSKNMYLEYGNDPIQNIKISDSDFVNKIYDFKKERGNLSWYHKLMDMGIKAHILFTVFIFAIIGLGYFFAIPWVAEKAVVIIPEDYDSHLGTTFFEQNMLFSNVDAEKTKALNLFAKELNLKNTKKLKFTVVDSPIVNAFALPDGNIVVFSGILNTMKNYDELVGLIGHEVAHVNHRHSMKMVCRNLSGYIFVSAILGDANGIMATIGDNVNNLQSLSYSRSFEHEADLEGFEIVVLNKINPKGMSNLFRRLQNEEVVAIPEFLSSHPVTTERIKDINELIKTKPFRFEDNLKLKKLFFVLKK